jgi:hypothetical protein
MWALPPQQCLGGEVGQVLLSHPWHRWRLFGPLSASPGLSLARSGVRTASTGELRELCSTNGMNLCQLVV